MNNDIYFQIGLVALIGLSAKNAILIVEFAREKHKQGMNVVDAALDAAQIRFRAIIMTSLTFILGALPLVTSQGCGICQPTFCGHRSHRGHVCCYFFCDLFRATFFQGH